jgi:DnaK suppressor protein
MKKDQFKKFQAVLLKKRQDLLANVSEEEKEGRDAVSIEAKDFGDMATEASGQEMSFAISDAGRRSLKDVDEALMRIEDGTFGTCVRCQKPIDEARLEAVPDAGMCISCKEAVEKENAR